CRGVAQPRARAGALEGDGRSLVAGQVGPGVGGGGGGVDGDGGGVVGEAAVLVRDPTPCCVGASRRVGEGSRRAGGVGDLECAVVVEVEAVLEPRCHVDGGGVGPPGHGERDRTAQRDRSVVGERSRGRRHVGDGGEGGGGGGASERVGDGQRGGVGAVIRVGVRWGQGSGCGRPVAECPGVAQPRARAGALEGDGRALVAGQSRPGVGGGGGGGDGDGGGVVGEAAVLVRDPTPSRVRPRCCVGERGGGGSGVGDLECAVVVEVEAVLEPRCHVDGGGVGPPGHGERDRTAQRDRSVVGEAGGGRRHVGDGGEGGGGGGASERV